MKLPVISLAILAGQVGLAASQGGDWTDKVDTFQSFYTGFLFKGPKFFPSNLVIGYAPWLVKRFAMAIARPRLPLRGLPVSLS